MLRLTGLLRSPWLWIGAGLLALVVSGGLVLRWYVFRSLIRGEAKENAEQERLCSDCEGRIRARIEELERSVRDGRTDRATTDRLFELIRLSVIGNNSREVSRWQSEPESVERRAVALKWAKAAADEFAYRRALHRIWRRDYDRGLTPHHITDDEVPPPATPEGWTVDDLMNRGFDATR